MRYYDTCLIAVFFSNTTYGITVIAAMIIITTTINPTTRIKPQLGYIKIGILTDFICLSRLILDPCLCLFFDLFEMSLYLQRPTSDLAYSSVFHHLPTSRNQ